MAKLPPLRHLTRQERTKLNQVLWARRILRSAPRALVRRAALVEQLTAATGLPERGAHHADPKG